LTRAIEGRVIDASSLYEEGIAMQVPKTFEIRSRARTPDYAILVFIAIAFVATAVMLLGVF
jgi:hypothetical protein